MINPHKDKKIDDYFVNFSRQDPTKKKTNDRILPCSKCGKPIKNEISAQYILCSEHFSSMFEDKVEENE